MNSIIYKENSLNINYLVESQTFLHEHLPLEAMARYLKMLFRNKKEFMNDFITYYCRYFSMVGLEIQHFYTLHSLVTLYDVAVPYTYKQAFRIENSVFRALVFAAINIEEMMKELGTQRIKTEGIPVKHRFYNENGTYVMKEYDLIYELHEVNGEKLSINEKLYAVKCWCTTTNKEHWLWVEERYADLGPLEAIASTCRIYKGMLPYIDCIKRQGDVYLFELSQEYIPSEKEQIVALDAKTYFSLLISQS